eukprot:1711544-Prymnesium_polylepis.2
MRTTQISQQQWDRRRTSNRGSSKCGSVPCTRESAAHRLTAALAQQRLYRSLQSRGHSAATRRPGVAARGHQAPSTRKELPRRVGCWQAVRRARHSASSPFGSAYALFQGKA